MNKAHNDGVYYWGRFPILRDEDPILTKKAREIYDWVASLPRVHGRIAFTFDGVSEVHESLKGDIYTICDEFYFKSITGAIDIDVAWDKYQSDLKKAGLEDIIADLQLRYDRLQ